MKTSKPSQWMRIVSPLDHTWQLNVHFNLDITHLIEEYVSVDLLQQHVDSIIEKIYNGNWYWETNSLPWFLLFVNSSRIVCVSLFSYRNHPMRVRFSLLKGDLWDFVGQWNKNAHLQTVFFSELPLLHTLPLDHRGCTECDSGGKFDGVYGQVDDEIQTLQQLSRFFGTYKWFMVEGDPLDVMNEINKSQ